MKKLLATALTVCGCLFVRAADNPPAAPGVVPLRSTNLHNVFAVTTNFFSGSSPEEDAAFAELARLGVKTIISVDGARPDAEAARRHGLRYVHLPIGYDRVPTNRVVELVKAAQTLPGPFYLHCHHGKHRGPAALAVMCAATAGWTTNQADAWLRQAGTAPDYGGLYRSAHEFRLPEAAALARVSELPEVAKTSSLVEAMVAIDEHFVRLKSAQKTAWREVPGQPDATPAHEATLLWEQFRELLRADDTARRSADYGSRLAGAERVTGRFRALLRDGPADAATRDAAFQAVGKTCAACHKKFRD